VDYENITVTASCQVQGLVLAMSNLQFLLPQRSVLS